ncbi:MAG: energy transducer TonB [Acidobacteria bacterium]|nr:energy transducer TonB [Acidobacteriota bacterium]
MAENIDSSHPQIADLRSVLEEAGVEVPERLSESGQIRERALRVGGDVTAPVVLERVEPVLSEVARAANVSGIVILEAVIDRNGKVVDVRVLKPLGFATDSAVEAVKKWKFRPGTLDGEPVDVIFALTVNVKPPRPGDGP